MILSDHDQIPETALAWHRGSGAALATVVETWGSAPRPAGSQLAVSADGAIAGSVSGGCVEGAVVAEAADALSSGRPTLLNFGVSDDEAFAVGLACGGRIRVLLEPVCSEPGLSAGLLERLVEFRRRRRPAALCVNLTTWERRLSGGGDGIPGKSVRARIAADRSGVDGDWFIGIHNPPLRMIVIGGVHIAQPLITMARLAGYDPVLVDPREAFATEARFPGETILHDWPDEAVETLGPDARTAVVTLSHDPKIDDPAILAALRTDAFYVGCLGSQRTHAKRVTRLTALGAGAADLNRIRAPVGMNIRARTPSEIAVAILAEMTEALRAPPEAA